MMAGLRLASVFVVVTRWSPDLDVVFIISDVCCTAMIEDEQIQSFHAQKNSMYKVVIDVGHVVNNKTLWKLKMLLKIKSFMWYLIKGVVLTKDNLTK